MTRAIFLSLLLCMSGPGLVACSPGGVQSAGETVVLTGTKALVVAEYAYQTANRAALAAVNAGMLNGQDAAKARVINAKIVAALDAGVRAQSLAAKASAASEALDLIAQLREVLAGPTARTKSFSLRPNETEPRWASSLF